MVIQAGAVREGAGEVWLSSEGIIGRISRVENSPLTISFIHPYLLISCNMLGNIPSPRNIAEKKGQRPPGQLIF